MSLKKTKEYAALQNHFDQVISGKHMRQLFKDDSERFNKFRLIN